jgi:glucosylceramidase
MPGVFVLPNQVHQTIEGFGACFNELGYDALQVLDDTSRAGIMREFFAPGVGANFTVCRMPIGANDFSRDWYSYAETPDDFGLTSFSIAHDEATLIPFLKNALHLQPQLRVWASPWSPPTWMKTNGHYAAAQPSPLQVGIETGIRPDQVGIEGTDMFIATDRFYATYAAYFGHFVDAYKSYGIDIAMVMPQNEFNSPQVFPSCTWTPTGLARFIAHLGPAMQRRGVEIYVGTLERANDALIEVVLRDPAVRRYISGAGFQWAGKGAIAAVARAHPELALYQTEQECGDGRNDWRYCRYAWTVMKHFLSNGVRAYQY